MRASRLLSLLLLLQTRGRMTAPELAEELEVSVRTVYRDVEALSSAGVPVYADRGPAGGYRLLDGYRTRLNGLTEAEASSLFLAGLPGPAAQLGLGEVAANAELKMLAALPPEPRSHAARMRERFHLDVPGWYGDGDETPFLGEVAEAVWEQRPLRMTYRRWGPRDVERVAHPYGLVLKGGAWYMVAVAGAGGPRTYRVSRILAAELMQGRFERPERFDLAAFWQEYATDFRERRMYNGEAVVRLAPGAEDLLRHTVGREVVDAALAAARPPGPPAAPGPPGPPGEECADGGADGVQGAGKGGVVLRLPIESVTHARWLLLRMGTQVEVLEPAELVELMRTAIADLAGLYGVGTGPARGPRRP